MKIAILGSAGHWVHAPFGDSSWAVWATNAFQYPRIDAYFQFHPDQDLEIYHGLLDWVKTQTIPIYMQQRREDVPGSVEYPLADLRAKYGSWFLTSSIALMLALALEQNPEEIGLWGVECAHTDEYREQKPGVHFFLQLAKMRGIKLTVPPECELLTPAKVYCYDRLDIFSGKVAARKAELERRTAELRGAKEQAVLKHAMLKGALEVTIPKELIQKQLDEVSQQVPEIDKALLTLDGALQLVDHIEKNWL